MTTTGFFLMAAAMLVAHLVHNTLVAIWRRFRNTEPNMCKCTTCVCVACDCK